MILVALMALCQCSSTSARGGGMALKPADCVVSVKDQKIAYYRDGHQYVAYPISTSRFGISDRPGHYGTPPGLMEVVAKIGHGVTPGTVFKNRQPTGEVIKPGSPGRDPIVSRIMWLRGLEPENQNAYSRCIYIHGTADEGDIGRPVSWGCIRMKSADVVTLFNALPIGSRVLVVEGGLPAEVPVGPQMQKLPPATTRPPLMVNPEGGLAAGRGNGIPEPAPPSHMLASATQATALASSRQERSSDTSERHSRHSSSYQTRALADGSMEYTSQDSAGPGIIMRSTHRATSSYETEKKPDRHGERATEKKADKTSDKKSDKSADKKSDKTKTKERSTADSGAN